METVPLRSRYPDFYLPWRQTLSADLHPGMRDTNAMADHKFRNKLPSPSLLGTLVTGTGRIMSGPVIKSLDHNFDVVLIAVAEKLVYKFTLDLAFPAPHLIAAGYPIHGRNIVIFA